MPGSRFQMRLDPWWRPLLLIGGATPGTSHLELDDETLSVRFGRLFNHTVPRNDIEDATQTSWPPWYGIGWRTDLRGRIGLIGSLGGVVEIKLGRPIRVWRVLTCRRLAVSLEEPERFLDALT
jgi:hypothetical protein